MTKASAVGLLREIGAAKAPRSPSRQRLREEALALLRTERLIEPAYHYRIVPLQPHDGPEFKVDGTVLHAPMLRPASGRLTALAFGVVTLGERIHARITELFAQRKPALALMLDDLGNDLLMGLSRRVQDRLMADCLRRQLSMAGELHAGDPGLDLDTQARVVELAGGDAIGLRVSAGGLLTPLKSGSMVFGVGENLPPANWSRCDTCPSRGRCKFVAETMVEIAV